MMWTAYDVNAVLALTSTSIAVGMWLLPQADVEIPDNILELVPRLRFGKFALRNVGHISPQWT
jgi:hypothetical protein